MTAGPAQKARLTVFFNHRYDGNLSKLDEFYGERFPGLTHLVPFYSGAAPNVIPVFASSYLFQGFFAQAASRLRDPDVSHYVFAADDLLLHPDLDAGSLVKRLGLDKDTGYIKELEDLAATPFEWQHWWRGVLPFQFPEATEFEPELPTVAAASEKLQRLGLGRSRKLSWRNFRTFDGGVYLEPRQRSFWLGLGYVLRGLGSFELPYPLLRAYSDFVVIPAGAFGEFTRLCGVFAAMGVFTEVAIPTALALTCPRVATEADVGVVGHELWDPADIQAMEARTSRRTDQLPELFGPDDLYIHPVKLSRWEQSS
jgi:hypothetical protein